MENKELKSFLEEGTDWFKNQRLPDFFPAFVAQIPDSINKLTTSLENQSKSNDRLSSSIKYATWLGVSVAALALILDLIKTFCIK